MRSSRSACAARWPNQRAAKRTAASGSSAGGTACRNASSSLTRSSRFSPVGRSPGQLVPGVRLARPTRSADAVAVQQLSERERRQRRLRRSQRQAAGPDDGMEQQANQLVAQLVGVRKVRDGYGADQLAHPLAPLTAQNDAAAGVVTFPDVAVDAAHNVQPTGRRRPTSPTAAAPTTGPPAPPGRCSTPRRLRRSRVWAGSRRRPRKTSQDTSCLGTCSQSSVKFGPT